MPSKPFDHHGLLGADQQYIRLFASHFLFSLPKPAAVTGISMNFLNAASNSRAQRAVDHAMVAGQRHGHLADELTLPSSVSTGARRAAPTARMVACGGLMIAENSRTPYMPRLEIALAPP